MAKEVITKFGERIKFVRLKLGVTQQKVADDLGIAQSVLCNYENGKREPDEFIVLSVFADYYKVSADWLLGRTSDMGMPEEEWKALHDKDLLRLREELQRGGWKAFGEKLPDKKINKLVGAIDKMLPKAQ